MSVEDALPSYHHRERHSIRAAAPPANSFASLGDGASDASGWGSRSDRAEA